MKINTDDPADHGKCEDVDPPVLLGSGQATEVEDESYDHHGDFDLLGGAVVHGDISND